MAFMEHHPAAFPVLLTVTHCTHSGLVQC